MAGCSTELESIELPFGAARVADRISRNKHSVPVSPPKIIPSDAPKNILISSLPFATMRESSFEAGLLRCSLSGMQEITVVFLHD